jgi:hypothetical protein
MMAELDIAWPSKMRCRASLKSDIFPRLLNTISLKTISPRWVRASERQKLPLRGTQIKISKD